MTITPNKELLLPNGVLIALDSDTDMFLIDRYVMSGMVTFMLEACDILRTVNADDLIACKSLNIIQAFLGSDAS